MEHVIKDCEHRVYKAINRGSAGGYAFEQGDTIAIPWFVESAELDSSKDLVMGPDILADVKYSLSED